MFDLISYAFIWDNYKLNLHVRGYIKDIIVNINMLNLIV